MAKEKDPAFLFYSKDWLEGTADMSKEAKGVFIDLMAHQHQKNGLPNDVKKLARLAAMSEVEFLPIWDSEVKEKFQLIDDRLYNRKLNRVMTERSDKGHRNKIIGTLASVVRLNPAPYEHKKLARQNFQIDDFMSVPDHNLTERLTEWFAFRLKSIANGNANGNANEIKDRGMGEGITFSMLHVFRQHFEGYAVDQKVDLPACMEIANKIAEAKGWPLSHVTAERKEDVLTEWGRLVVFAASDKWFRTRALSNLNKEFQTLTQSANGTHKQNSGSPQFVPSLAAPGSFGKL
jgi:uncharacterized protein YdaU (DUF1376 family)